jgi:short-subunit dehydrogenase
MTYKAKNLKDKIVLVSGGSQGIGKELGCQLLKYGSKVVLTGRNQSKINSLKSELESYKDNVLILKADITSQKDNLMVIKETVSFFGGLDVLINNAALSAQGHLSDTSDNVIHQLIDTNIKGVLFLTKYAIPELIKSKGSILFISSIASFYGLPNYSLYSMTKSSLTALSESLRLELKQNNVFVGICYLGFTENEPAKQTFNSDGTLIVVPKRNKLLIASRNQSVKKILRQLVKKRTRRITSWLGIMLLIASKFPTLITLFFSGAKNINPNHQHTTNQMNC